MGTLIEIAGSAVEVLDQLASRPTGQALAPPTALAAGLKNSRIIAQLRSRYHFEFAEHGDDPLPARDRGPALVAQGDRALRRAAVDIPRSLIGLHSPICLGKKIVARPGELRPRDVRIVAGLLGAGGECEHEAGTSKVTRRPRV